MKTASIAPVIVLFTDFGLSDPYVGQLHAVFAHEAPGVAVIDLFHSVPPFNIRAGAYLLSAYSRDFPPETVFVCVVDPGVGSARRPIMFRADKRWYVGPDNGLFEVVKLHAREHQCHVIRWRPAKLSASFHGRDLFAPIAAQLVRGEVPEADPAQLTTPPGASWPEDLAEIIHIDHYGNAITGLRAKSVTATQEIWAGGEVIKYARVFSEVPPGRVFWYENANGLVEIAIHGDSAAVRFGFKPGDPVTLSHP
ncbi:MAG: SAM-dependent chlorinase/fluorinase [Gammaproteobacteria bacterium]|nr:SAM-dependent chlorinase/fluorinase [Gammaproteobacteria bacterium]MDH3406354.1 SAM-dependent chlorinase/fluorinase [Gammaproteobacteria bacterium]MDH5486804.1 SAM-dependent chlorinase/fluorinase [Gammaproteobacteria bacterium]